MVCMCHAHEGEQTRNTMLQYGPCEIAMTSRRCLLPLKHTHPTRHPKHARNPSLENTDGLARLGFVGEVRRGWPSFPVASNTLDHRRPGWTLRP